MIKIDRDSKILGITHQDLDGVVCSILLKKVFKNIDFLDINFGTVDSTLRSIRYDLYDFIILTDIHPDDSSNLDIGNNKVILLDHHSSAESLNDPSKMRFVVTGICGAVLVKRFLENYFKVDLSQYNSLVYLTNDYDIWIHKNKKSKMLADLYSKYWSDGFRKRFSDGKTRLYPQEIQYLRKSIEMFNSHYEELEVMDLETIDGCFVVSDKYPNECCDKLMKEENYKIVIFYIPKRSSFSVRHVVEGLHIGNILKELGFGGGHEKAGGIKNITKDNFGEVLKKLEKQLYLVCPLLRRK